MQPHIDLCNLETSGHHNRDYSAVGIDPEWESQIRRDVMIDCEGRGLDEELIAARLNHQLAAARELTQSVLQSDTFLTSTEVARILEAQCPGISSEHVSALRESGYFVSLPVAGNDMYPLFQFDSESLPRDVIEQVTGIVHSDRAAWGTQIWWFLEHPRLDGESPAHWLNSEKDSADVVRLFESMTF